MKKIAALLLTVVMCLAAVPSLAAWEVSGGRYWYSWEDGGYAANTWLQDGGAWYWFDGDGWMVTGWQQIGGTWYYFDGSGAMVTGWKQIGGTWYYFSAGGAMQTGWLLDGGVWYYFSPNGAMQTGWALDSGAWYYFSPDGAMMTGWLQQGDSWYYLDDSGAMATGTRVINGKEYFFDDGGVWQDTAAETETGWILKDNGYVYILDDGTAVTGWQQIDGTWYYFSKDGLMQTGWLQQGSDWYYLASSGAMVTGSFEIDGVPYSFDESGRWLEGEELNKIDFGGRTVYIYDWWGMDDAEHSYRAAEPDDETRALYDYRDWLEKTYNVKIVETALSDWMGNPDELKNIVMNGGLNGKGDEGDWCIVAIAPDFASGALTDDLYMPWTIDLSDKKWNPAANDFMTKDGKVLGVNAGKTEPRNCLFFNKRVLEEAGIDWNTIYDMQKDGTWTWEAWENIMAQVQRDTDNDGEIDIYGLTGSGDDMAVGLVFSNGASFFDKDENGRLTLAVDSQGALDALEERVKVWDTFSCPPPEDANWDWFKDYWKEGKSAFYSGQTWQGFNNGAELADMQDEWGCVMIPKGPDAETYKAVASDNIYGVPNVYSPEVAEKIQMIYDLYTNDAPGTYSEDNWIGNKYEKTDERAVDETYAMMREPEHSAPNYTLYLGSTNDVLGPTLLWGAMDEMGPAQAVEESRGFWQDLIDVFNGIKVKK